MKFSKYNSEHYLNLTAYEAMVNIDREERARRFRPLVYICSPYAGDVETNTANARRYSRFAIESHTIPITPHLLYPQFLDDNVEAERDLGRFIGIVLLSKCSEIWVFGDRISEGMKAEIDRARYKNIPIRYFSTDCKEVQHYEI